MCALFGPRVGVHAVDLEVPVHAWGEPIRLSAHVSRVPTLSATVRLGPLNETIAAVRRLEAVGPTVTSRPFSAPVSVASATSDLTLTVLGHPVKQPPLTATGRRLGDLILDTRAHDVGPVEPPRMRAATEFMRDRPVERRGVSASRLTPEQVAHWVKRLSDSKRVSVKQIDLVAVFPNVPIVGDAPVAVSAGALSYRLPDKPVPLTTVVVARNLHTGASIVGRFAKS